MEQELGGRIRALRKERGISQEALAQALDVSRQAVTKWEDGSSFPSTANLLALSGFFGVPLSELTGTPEPAASAAPSAVKAEHGTRRRTLQMCAWLLLAVCVGVLAVLLIQLLLIAPPLPKDVAIIGGADGPTQILVAGEISAVALLPPLIGAAAAAVYLLHSRRK